MSRPDHTHQSEENPPFSGYFGSHTKTPRSVAGLLQVAWTVKPPEPLVQLVSRFVGTTTPTIGLIPPTLPSLYEASKPATRHIDTSRVRAWAMSYAVPIGIVSLLLLVTAYILAHLSTALVLSVISITITAQGLFALYLMLYAWEDPHHVDRARSPRVRMNPQLSFTALVPVRHEVEVIQSTLQAIARIHYPTEKTQTLVICSEDDTETIQAVRNELARTAYNNTELVIYNEAPINKPHALNVALEEARNDVVVVFDAEDEPHQDIYSIVNTVMLRDDADIVQSGVQLMNHRSNWYSLFNVMEYYFWFKSSLHFFARMNTIPLGGNTVFFKRMGLLAVNGWDQDCLTEDADVGIRMSAAGAKVSVVYDEEHATREETPPTLGGLIKQRTRWNQGFLQILLRGTWQQFRRSIYLSGRSSMPRCLYTYLSRYLRLCMVHTHLQWLC
jgi:cellulose synthase/poly-beta-1,6-N-acetylglucosamine synthase-like glycosyltransferase